MYVFIWYIIYGRPLACQLQCQLKIIVKNWILVYCFVISYGQIQWHSKLSIIVRWNSNLLAKLFTLQYGYLSFHYSWNCWASLPRNVTVEVCYTAPFNLWIWELLTLNMYHMFLCNNLTDGNYEIWWMIIWWACFLRVC